MESINLPLRFHKHWNFTPLLLLILLVFVASTRGDEPVLNGKNLTGWLEETGQVIPEPRRQVAYAAIRAMGTNALPYLLARIDKEDTQRIIRLEHGPGFTEKDRLGLEAICGFEALGTTAEPAIPELEKLIKEDGAPFAASAALGMIGLKAYPILTNGLQSRSEAIRAASAFAVKSFLKDHEELNPVLVALARDKSTVVRRCALDTLGSTSKPESVVSVLTESLSDADWYARGMAAWSLGKCGNMATTSIPKLEELLPDQNIYVRFRATNAIAAIRNSK